MKTKTCLQCANLKYQQGKCWCSKGHFRKIDSELPVKPSTRFKAARICKDYESMDDAE